MSYDLSVLIPARAERWLPRTVDGVLERSSDRTEVIVALDGEWSPDPLPQHPRLSVLYLPDPVGQRAATNLAARASQARWVMKLDAHCILSPGFDEVLMDAMEGHDDWTIVPKMYNLHAFDWLCPACETAGRLIDEREGRPAGRLYQGPTPDACPGCGSEMVMDEKAREYKIGRAHV